MLKLFIDPFIKDVPDIHEMNKKQKIISAFFSFFSLILLLFIFSYFYWNLIAVCSSEINMNIFLDNLKWMLFITISDYFWLILGKGFVNSLDNK